MIESSYDPTTRRARARSACGSSCRRAARSTACARITGSTSAAIRCARRSRRWTTSRDLYQRFGDWQIALAAFNVGYGAMLRSIARYNTNDYYQLCEYENGLPWETCLYTPKVLAAAIVGHNRAVFGYDKHQGARRPRRGTRSRCRRRCRSSVIARAAGATEADDQAAQPAAARRAARRRARPATSCACRRGAKAEFAAQARRARRPTGMATTRTSSRTASGSRTSRRRSASRSAQLRKLNDVAREARDRRAAPCSSCRGSPTTQRAKNQAKAKAKLLALGHRSARTASR